VQNLVDIYRYETLAFPCNYEEVDLQAVITSCIEQLSHYAEDRKVTINWQPADSQQSIQADTIGLRRVIMNLLHNAVKFNKEGGQVGVAIHRKNGWVQMTFIDTGTGINESEQSQLFQRFGQGKAGRRFASGTGLGLYLCKQIIEAHQGTITCESKIGTGASFIVTIPVTDPGSVKTKVPNGH
jgi:signal transduction histidine kinase